MAHELSFAVSLNSRFNATLRFAAIGRERPHNSVLARANGPVLNSHRMGSFCNRDLTAFSGALERLYDVMEEDAYSGRVFEVVERLVPGVVVSVDSHNTATRASTSFVSRFPEKDVTTWRQRLLELIPTHPAFHPIQREPRQVLAITDCTSHRKFKETALYHDVMKPLNCAYQVVVGLEIPQHVAGVTISRDRDFAENERVLLRLLGPHLERAHVNVQRFSRLRSQQDGSVPAPECLVRLGTTPRESEVLHWIMLGKRDSEIAQIVGCSLRTVHKHVTRILAKLCVETRTAAAQEAARRWRGLSLR